MSFSYTSWFKFKNTTPKLYIYATLLFFSSWIYRDLLFQYISAILVINKITQILTGKIHVK